jgi:cytochrome c-type biogenesis protein CcmE
LQPVLAQGALSGDPDIAHRAVVAHHDEYLVPYFPTQQGK